MDPLAMVKPPEPTERESGLDPSSKVDEPLDENNLLSARFRASSPVEIFVVFGILPATELRLIRIVDAIITSM